MVARKSFETTNLHAFFTVTRCCQRANGFSFDKGTEKVLKKIFQRCRETADELEEKLSVTKLQDGVSVPLLVPSSP